MRRLPAFNDLLTVSILLLMSGAFISHLVDLSNADSVTAGSGRMQLIWLGVYLLTLYRVVPNWKATWAVMRANLPLCIFSLLAVVSMLWSADPSGTLRHGVAFVFSTLFGIDFARRYTLQKQIQLVTATLWLAIGLSCLVQLFFPGFAVPATFGEANIVDPDAWIGIYNQKNIFGHVLATAGVLTLSQIRGGSKNLVRSGFALLVCLLVIAKAKSGTALVVIVSTGFLLLSLSVLRRSRRFRATVGPAIALASLSVVICAVFFRDSLATGMGRTSDLTGRTDIWSLVLESFGGRPFLGYGFGGFWQVTPQSRHIDYLLGWTVPSSHNLYLDILLQSGLVGFGLFGVAYLRTLAKSTAILRRTGLPEMRWPLAYLLMTTIYGVTESDLYSPNSMYWVLFTATCVTATRYAFAVRQSHRTPISLYGQSALPAQPLST